MFGANFCEEQKQFNTSNLKDSLCDCKHAALVEG